MEQAKSVKLSDEMVLDKIYFIRNQKVMLDSDLAKLYGVAETSCEKKYRPFSGRFYV